MKKDLKIVSEMRKFLQRRVNFLEEENRKLQTKGREKTEEGIKDLKIWGTEMMEMFQSPTRIMDEDTGEFLTIKHYNSNKNSILNSFDKNNSRLQLDDVHESPMELQLPKKESKVVIKKKKKLKMKNLEICIPENEKDPESSAREKIISEVPSKRKMRFQIKRKSVLNESELVPVKKKKKKKMNILIPDEDIKQKVRSTRMNKKIHFENESVYKPSQENTYREVILEKKDLLFEKKKHIDTHHVSQGLDPSFIKNFTNGKANKTRPAKKTKRRKTKKIHKGTLKMLSSSNLDKHSNPKVHTSYKRIQNKSKGIWFYDSKKRERKQGRIRRGTEGAMYSTKNGSLMTGLSPMPPSREGAKIPPGRLRLSNKGTSDFEDIFKNTNFVKKKGAKPRYGLIQSVNEIELHSQKNIRGYKKQISIDPQDKLVRKDWVSRDNSEENLGTGDSQKIIYSNRNLIVDRIKTEPPCKVPIEHLDFNDKFQNSSFQMNQQNKNSCSISVSDIKSEKKRTAPLKKTDHLLKSNLDDFNQIFQYPHRQKGDSRSEFAMTHLFIQNPGRKDIYKNLNLKSVKMQGERRNELKEGSSKTGLLSSQKSDLGLPSKKSKQFKFSEDFITLNRQAPVEGKRSKKQVGLKYDFKNNPLNLTGKIHTKNPAKKKDRLSVKSGVPKQMKIQNYTSSKLGIIGQKYAGGMWYQENIIGKMTRKGKFTDSNKKYMSKERKKKNRQKKRPNDKEFSRNLVKAKSGRSKRQQRISNQIYYPNVESNKSNDFAYKDSVSNSESNEGKYLFDLHSQELHSLELKRKKPITNTFERKNEDILSDQMAQYHSCKSITKGNEKVLMEDAELIKNKFSK